MLPLPQVPGWSWSLAVPLFLVSFMLCIPAGDCLQLEEEQPLQQKGGRLEGSLALQSQVGIISPHNALLMIWSTASFSECWSSLVTGNPVLGMVDDSEGSLVSSPGVPVLSACWKHRSLLSLRPAKIMCRKAVPPGMFLLLCSTCILSFPLGHHQSCRWRPRVFLAHFF